MPLWGQAMEMSKLDGMATRKKSLEESWLQCELAGVMNGVIHQPLWVFPPLPYEGFSRGDCVSLPPCSGILSSSSVPSVTHPGLMRLAVLSRASTGTTKEISIHSQCIFLWRQGSAESGCICGLLYLTWQPQSCEEFIAWDKGILFLLLHLGGGEEMGPIGLLVVFCITTSYSSGYRRQNPCPGL